MHFVHQRLYAQDPESSFNRSDATRQPVIPCLQPFLKRKIWPRGSFLPLTKDSIVLNPTPASTASKMALFYVYAQTGGILKSPAGPWAFEIGPQSGGLLNFELNVVGF